MDVDIFRINKHMSWHGQLCGLQREGPFYSNMKIKSKILTVNILWLSRLQQTVLKPQYLKDAFFGHKQIIMVYVQGICNDLCSTKHLAGALSYLSYLS